MNKLYISPSLDQHQQFSKTAADMFLCCSLSLFTKVIQLVKRRIKAGIVKLKTKCRPANTENLPCHSINTLLETNREICLNE